jgi:hypothetical protein
MNERKNIKIPSEPSSLLVGGKINLITIKIMIKKNFNHSKKRK